MKHFPDPNKIKALFEHRDAVAMQNVQGIMDSIIKDFRDKLASPSLIADNGAKVVRYDVKTDEEAKAIAMYLLQIFHREGYDKVFPSLRVVPSKEEHDNGYGRQTAYYTFTLKLN